MKLPHFTSYAQKFFFIIGMTFIIIFGIVGSVVYFVSSRFYKKRFLEFQRTYSRLVTVGLGEAYIKYKRSGFSRFLEIEKGVMKNNPDLKRIIIAGVDGKRYYDTEKQNHIIKEISGYLNNIKPVYLLKIINGKKYLLVISPFKETWGIHRYTIIYFISFESLYRFQHMNAIILFLSLVFTIGISIFVALILSRSITEPIEKLSFYAEKVSAGNYDVDVSVKDAYELTKFANTLDLVIKRFNFTLEHLKELSRAKSTLLARVSHELKTPLTASLGYIDFILEGKMGKVNPDIQRGLEVAKRNLERLQEKIEEILTAAREEKGRDYELGPFSLRNLLMHLAENLESKIVEKGLFLEINCPENIPPVYGDRKKIMEVFENLLDNAMKFTYNGGIRINVERQDKKMAKIMVMDTGIGIHKDKIYEVFDEFVQADEGMSKKIGGIGLGLSIVKEIIEKHKGKIWIESKIGKGTSIFFTLPIYLQGGE